MKTKVCTKCHKEKSLSAFNKHPTCKYGVISQCRVCRSLYRKTVINTPEVIRKRNLKGKYNLTIEEYDKLLMEQNGICAICGKKESTQNPYGIKRLSVDHDHITKKVRGLLCVNCNTALGSFFVDEKNDELLLNAVEYVRKTKN